MKWKVNSANRLKKLFSKFGKITKKIATTIVLVIHMFTKTENNANVSIIVFQFVNKSYNTFIKAMKRMIHTYTSNKGVLRQVQKNKYPQILKFNIFPYTSYSNIANGRFRIDDITLAQWSATTSSFNAHTLTQSSPFVLLPFEGNNVFVAVVENYSIIYCNAMHFKFMRWNLASR